MGRGSPRLLTFLRANQLYGVELASVQEIVNTETATWTVSGELLGHNGDVIEVVDPATWFHPLVHEAWLLIVVTGPYNTRHALACDRIGDVLDVPSEMAPAPDGRAHEAVAFVDNVERRILVPDLKSVFPVRRSRTDQ